MTGIMDLSDKGAVTYYSPGRESKATIDIEKARKLGIQGTQIKTKDGFKVRWEPLSNGG